MVADEICACHLPSVLYAFFTNLLLSNRALITFPWCAELDKCPVPDSKSYSHIAVSFIPIKAG